MVREAEARLSKPDRPIALRRMRPCSAHAICCSLLEMCTHWSELQLVASSSAEFALVVPSCAASRGSSKQDVAQHHSISHLSYRRQDTDVRRQRACRLNLTCFGLHISMFQAAFVAGGCRSPMPPVALPRSQTLPQLAQREESIAGTDFNH